MARKQAVTTCCTRCKGTGRIELSSAHAETLTLLRAQPSEITGSDLALVAGVNPNAMNSRLVVLESLGLAVGRRDGRARFWTATHPQKKGGA